ncbi:MAG TPA: hypothetical protein VE173_07965, partial [Longimicrobiales bacterium]|nr:hypothetical protein [Longimicrobiales bacterium]
MSDQPPRKRSYREEEPPRKIGGAIGGATLGAVGGSLAIGALGPLGGLLAALASYAGGWWAGRTLAGAVDELGEVDERLRDVHDEAGPALPWEEIRHAYQVGYLAAQNPRWAESEFEEVEEDLAVGWAQAHEESEGAMDWEEVREGARLGWEVAREPLD